MGHVTIKYGSHEHVWQDGDHLNDVTSSGMLSMTTESGNIDLRQFDSQEEAEAARESLSDQIAEGLGNGTIVIDVDDL